MSIDIAATRARVIALPGSTGVDIALGLLAEVERLREQRRIDNEEAARLYDFARDKGKALERAAVVAWLRAPGTSCDTDVLADAIERGDHRREEER